MRKIKVALIGAGVLANRVHYPSLAEFKDVEIVGLCDIVEEKLKKTAESFKIKDTFVDYKEMLEKTSPEAIYILMPPHYIYDIVIHCLNEKMHVFIEKPPGITKEQTREMSLIAEKNSCLTMVGFQRRFAPLSVKARNMILKRGKITQCAATYYKNTLGAPPYYGGALDILTSDVIHAVDNLRWMGGEVKEVVSNVRSLWATYDNSFNAFLKFESGAVGVLMSNWVAGKRIFSIQMHGKGISAFVEPEKEAVIYKDNEGEGKVSLVEDEVGSKEFYKIGGFFQENRHFIDCVKKGKLPETNLGDSYKTMELVDRIYHSQI